MAALDFLPYTNGTTSARPTIGITPDFAEAQGPAGSGKYELKTAYCDAVLRAGGLPVVLPYARERAAIEAYLKRVQGLLISGGGFDIPPSMYGQRRKSCCCMEGWICRSTIVASK